MNPIKVLVVDDSSVVRRIIKEALDALPDIDVIATAADPFEARDKIKQYNPDVLTLDIELPGMDGLAFLEKIMQLRPMPVVMVSRFTREDAGPALRALELGAVDYVHKPFAKGVGNVIEAFTRELAGKIRAAAHARVDKMTRTRATIHRLARQHAAIVKLIAIGASTGGVETLCYLFARLPGKLPPILVTQHMPAAFTGSFAARLDSLGPVRVVEAADGMVLQSGHAYIAPGGLQMGVAVNNRHVLECHVHDGEKMSGHKPSVDYLFYSAAETVGQHALGIILTGMGHDGAHGLLAMRKRGALTIGQDEQSAVIYGMPKEAAALDAVVHQLPLGDIPQAMVDAVMGSNAPSEDA